MINQTLKIRSLAHPLVKRLVKLRESRSFRSEEQEALLCCDQVIEELRDVLIARLLLVSENCRAPLPAAERIFFVSDNVLKKVAGLPSFSGHFAAVYALPPPSHLSSLSHMIACDGVSDPGNLGTLIRSALGLGWGGIFLLPGCVDPFNDKTIRASRGGSFLLPYANGSIEDVLSLAQKNGMEVLLADVEGIDIRRYTPPSKILLILGAEAKGLREKTRQCGKAITIPLHPSLDSLNVAVAGSILMYACKT